MLPPRAGSNERPRAPPLPAPAVALPPAVAASAGGGGGGGGGVTDGRGPFPHSGLDRRDHTLKGLKAFAARPRVALVSAEAAGVRFKSAEDQLAFEVKDKVLCDAALEGEVRQWMDSYLRVGDSEHDDGYPHLALAGFYCAAGARVFGVLNNVSGRPSAPPGQVVVPGWMLQVLGVESGAEVAMRPEHAAHVDSLVLAPHHPGFANFFPRNFEGPLKMALSEPEETSTNVLVVAPPWNEAGPPPPAAVAGGGGGDPSGAPAAADALLSMTATYKGQPLPLMIDPGDGGGSRLFWFDVYEARTGRGLFDGTTPMEDFLPHEVASNPAALQPVGLAMLYGKARSHPNLYLDLTMRRRFVNGAELPLTPVVHHPLLRALPPPPRVRERAKLVPGTALAPGEAWPPAGGVCSLHAEGGAPAEAVSFFTTVKGPGAGLEVMLDVVGPLPPAGEGGGGGARLPEVYAALGGEVERPHPRKWAWADTGRGAGGRKRLFIEPWDPLVRAHAERVAEKRGAEGGGGGGGSGGGGAAAAPAEAERLEDALFLSLTLYMPAPFASSPFSLRVREIPADCADARARAAAAAAAAGGPPSAHALAPGEQRCEACGTGMAAANLPMHQLRCARQERCKEPTCLRALGPGEAASHVHCGRAGAGGCARVFGSAEDAARHFEVAHAPFPCELCNRAGMTLEPGANNYEVHLSAPAAVEGACGKRLVNCPMCERCEDPDPRGFQPGGALRYEDLGAHRAACKSKTGQCRACKKASVRRELLLSAACPGHEAAEAPAAPPPERAAAGGAAAPAAPGGGADGCPQCTFVNSPGRSACEMCGQALPRAAAAAPRVWAWPVRLRR